MKPNRAQHKKTPQTTTWSLITDWHWWLDHFLPLNSAAFPYLYVIANVLLTLELVTYRGFTFRYLFLEARLMLAVAMVSFLVIFGQRLQKATTLPRLTQLVLELNSLAIVPLLLINYLLVSLDLYYYPNYVYSKFHINTNNLQLMISLNGAIIALQLIQSSRSVATFVWQRLNKKALINILFLVTVAGGVLPNAQTVSKWMYDAGIRIVRTVNLSWEERFIYLNGGLKSTGWITPYTKFVNRHVPAQATIFIPPQMEAWQMEGNPYYIRWFIYPRYTVQAPEIVAPIPAEADYVLIDNGAWPGMTEYGWPRIFIPAEQIVRMVFIDRESGVETVVTGQAYDPATMAHKWGVIELKKNQ